jgi:hypothetical protein
VFIKATLCRFSVDGCEIAFGTSTQYTWSTSMHVLISGAGIAGLATWSDAAIRNERLRSREHQ